MARILDNMLAEATPPGEIKYRQAKFGLTDGESVQMLAYIDARYVMQKLDEVFGVANWTNEYILIGGKTFCKLTANFPDGTVVSKMDVGAETDFEQEKGVVSDALKRTAVLFGIGRDLYSLPKYWAVAGHNGFVSRDWKPPQSDNTHIPNPKKAGGDSGLDSDILPNKPPPALSIQQRADEVVANLEKRETPAQPKIVNYPPPAQTATPDVITINNVELMAVSKKAIMIEQHGSGAGEVWIPISQIKGKTVNNVGETGTVDIPGWLADKNGLTSGDNKELPF